VFAAASAAAHVASTLSLPIRHDGRVVAGVNLYAATRDAFEGHHEELAAALGAWAPGAVANADLSFTTRAAAAEAPRRLTENDETDMTAGMLSEALGISVGEAGERLRNAAARAGLPVSRVATAIQEALRPT
jgi:GAF domain-containing protein